MNVFVFPVACVSAFTVRSLCAVAWLVVVALHRAWMSESYVVDVWLRDAGISQRSESSQVTGRITSSHVSAVITSVGAFANSKFSC